MSNTENNPFAQDSENPFADPAVASVTSNAARGLEDYNPFAEQAGGQQSTSSKMTTSTVAATSQQPPAPALQPAVLETKQEPPPYVVAEEQENLRRRQDELERKAAELQRKEQELQRMQFAGIRENNFPPLPKFCPCKPCFVHDITLDIPVEYQRTCRLLFFNWQAYTFTLIYNFLTALALLITNADEFHGGSTFGLSILYLVVNVPLSFLCWYRPAYNALKNDSSFSYVIFFLDFFFHIGLMVFYSLGVPGGGTCGWINATTAIHKSKAVGAMMFISAGFFTLGTIWCCFLLVKIHHIYRMAGASFEKAQGEFARGVASNKNVQAAATEAVVSGVRASNQK